MIITTVQIVDVQSRHGCVGQQDIDRAQGAAMAVLRNAGVGPAEAEAEFIQQWAYLESDAAAEAGLDQHYDNITGVASAWLAAERAANAALTHGWDKPGEASCGISA